MSAAMSQKDGKPTSVAPYLSVIVATFNEEANIEQCVRRILAVFAEGCELLVVDGGSDRTGEIVQELAGEFPAIRYVRNDNDRGKGHAIRTGIAFGGAGLLLLCWEALRWKLTTHGSDPYKNVIR